MDVGQILEKVKCGKLSVEMAKQALENMRYEELGYAKLDTDRKKRTGFAEVVFCSGKANEQLLEIYKRIYESEGEVLGTRATQVQYEWLKKEFPEIMYDPESKILKIEKAEKNKKGMIAVCTAGK